MTIPSTTFLHNADSCGSGGWGTVVLQILEPGHETKEDLSRPLSQQERELAEFFSVSHCRCAEL